MRAARPQSCKRVLRNCRFARQLANRHDGLALVEFAYALPVLIILIFAGAELANLAIAHARVSAITSMIADGVARVRDRIDENDINDIITGAKYSGESLQLTSRGRIIISTLEDNASTTNPVNDQIITWQRCKGVKSIAVGQTIGSEGTTLASGIGSSGDLIATPGNPIVVVEIFYDYRPIMSDRWFGPLTIHYSSAFSVRDRSLQTLQNGQSLSGAAKATCGYYSA